MVYRSVNEEETIHWTNLIQVFVDMEIIIVHFVHA